MTRYATAVTSPDIKTQQQILDDNRRLHDAPGYAEFYDRVCGVVAHPWERQVVLTDLARIAGRMTRRPVRALDVGCGTGNLTAALLDLGAAVHAVDLSAGMLNRLLAKHHKDDAAGRLITICGDADSYLDSRIQAGQTFDVVCAASFLHHVPDYMGTLGRMAQLVAPGGCLYVAHEPPHPSEINHAARVLNWIDMKLDRIAVRLPAWTGLNLERDRYWSRDCLADYWTGGRGLDRARLIAMLEHHGLAAEATLYGSARRRWLLPLVRLARARLLLKLQAWRPYPDRQHSR